jgi:NAD(P)-dependent dehydrogenase (short-subunit alcohol dehydrogenase family)
MAGVLQGKTIIVTGAGRGIGEAAARLFAKAGAQLVLANRDVGAGEALARELTDAGGSARFVRTDVAEEADVQAMVQAALGSFGRIDGAFNNAGIGYANKPLHLLEREEWQRTIDVNLTGVFLCMKHQIATMLEHGGGSIVNAGSISGVVGLPNAAEYNAAKHGILGLMRNAALDYGKQGIRVNTLLIGATLTPLLEQQLPGITGNQPLIDELSPIGRLAQPSEVGEAALWLLSDASSFVNGSALTIDGGYTAK